MTDVGVVVIGRNEGERLREALRAAARSGAPVVYADSGSTDGSPDAARSEGADVVVVTETPMTAARGRNEGLARLRSTHAGVRWIQFVDGDTVLDAEWIRRAADALAADAKLGAVCGHLAEHGASSSAIRRLVQADWRGPSGDIAACGGNAMYSRAALDAAGTFEVSLAGGEEAELCGRLRSHGFRIARLDLPMGVHDSRIDSFAAWWSRAVRVGRSLAALAGGVAGHRPPAARAALRSAFVWGLGLPLALAAGVVLALVRPDLVAVPLVIAAVLVLQTVRILVRSLASGLPAGDAAVYAIACMAGKAAYVCGWLSHRSGSTS